MTNIRKDDMAIALVHRLSHHVMWLAFALFHSALLSILLAFAWAYSIQAHAVADQLHKVALFLHIQETWQMLAFWGLSGSTILAIYVLGWRKIYWSFVRPYLFKTINAAAHET